MDTGNSDLHLRRAAGHTSQSGQTDETALIAPASSVEAAAALLPMGIKPLFTQDFWKNNVNGVWSNAANWSTGTVPGAANSVLLDTVSARTVTFASGSGTIASLNAVTDTLAITGGTLTILTTAVFGAGLNLSSTNGTETLAIDGATASVAGTFNPGVGYVSLGTATTLSASGPVILSGSGNSYGETEIDGGALKTSGTTTIVDPGSTGYLQAIFGGGIVWTNTGTVDDGGVIWTGDGNGATAAFVNAAGAVFDFTSDDGQIDNGTVYGVAGAGSSTFSNAGTIEKIGGGGGTSSIFSVVTNTGTIDAATGTIEFDGGGTFGGTLTGAGQVAFGGGNATLTAGTNLNAANLMVDGADLAVTTRLAYAGNLSLTGGELQLDGTNDSVAGSFYQSNSSTLYLNGSTLSLTGAFFNYGTLEGPGTLSTSGTTTLAIGSTYNLGNGVSFINAGTVNQDLDVYGSGGGFSITNNAGATYIVNGGSNLDNTTGDSTFTNAGTFQLNSGSDFYVNSAFTNTGTIVSSSGLIHFEGGGAFGGTLSGAGVIDFDGGNSTLLAGAVYAAATIEVTGGSLTLDANSTPAASSFSQLGGNLYLNGNTLTLASGNLSGGALLGPGSLLTSGTTTVQGYSIGNSVEWVNTGIVNQVGTSYNNNGSATSFDLVNKAGATYNLSINNNLAYNYNPQLATMENAGILALAGGAGEAYVDSIMTNTGTILANTGTLAFEGGGLFGGTLTGTGAIDFGGGNSTLTSGSVFTAAALDLDGGYVEIAAGASFNTSSVAISSGTLKIDQNIALASGVLNDGGEGYLYLNGNTLSAIGATLSGYVYGSGDLLTSGATTANDGFVIGSGATWTNTGVTTLASGIVDGFGGFNLVNKLGAVFNVAGSYQIAGSTSYVSTINNSGSFEESTSDGSATVYAVFNNTSTGTINTGTSGTISLYSGGSLTGTLSGKGTLQITNSNNSTYSLGGLSAATTAAFDASGAIITLSGNESLSDTVVLLQNAVALGTDTLSLNGTTSFGTTADYYVYANTFDGAGGTLSTGGSASILDYQSGFLELSVGGGATWSNSGKVADAGLIQLGDGSGGGVLINTSAGVFSLTTSDANIDQGSYVNSFGNTLASAATIFNAGTFAKTTTGGTSSIYGTFNNTGTIATTAGYLQFDNGGSLSGLIADKSNIQLENGVGFTFGTLTIGGSAAVTSGVTVDATGTLTMGDTTNTGKAIFLNQGIYEIDGNGGILAGTGSATQSFDNQTLLEKISGTGRSVVSAYVSNTGTILANSGTLALTGTVTNTGKLQIGAGATLELGSLVATTQSISFTANTGTLALDTVSGTHSTIAGFTVGDEIDLVSNAANTATLTGTTLVVYETTTAVATLSLTGTHTGDTYSFLSDGHGGTLLGISANATAWKGTSNDWLGTNVWTNGPPSAQTNATVTSTGKYTLSLAASETGYANTLQLDGTTATYAINGQLDITKSIAFQAGTLSLAGTIDGGTLTISGGTQNYIGGTLEGVAYQGALNLTGASQSLTLQNPLALSGASGSGGATINLTGAGAELFIDGVTTLASGVIDIGNASAASTLASNDADGNGGVLILGASVTVSQTGLYAALTDSGGPYDAILNGGTIDATATDGTFTITGADFENDGTITLKNGDTLDIGSAVFVNTGTLASSGATLTLSGSLENDGSIKTSFTTLNLNGTLTTAQLLAIFGGSDTVSIGGTLINTGATLNVGAGTTLGTISLPTGTIIGGTIADAGNGLVLGVDGATYGTLSGVTYEGTINVSGGLWIQGSLTATGVGGTGPGSINDTTDGVDFRFNDTQTFNNAAIQFGSNGPDGVLLSVSDDTGDGATLTLGSGVTITQAGTAAFLYYYESNDEIINQGSILADSAGGTFNALSTYSTGNFANQGSITVSNGDVFALNGSGSFANLPGTTLTGGYYEADASSVIQLANNSTVTSLAATITLSGTGSDIESLNTNTSAEVQIDSQLSSIAAGGALNLLSGRSFSATANHGTFTDAGLLNLSGTKFTSTSLAIAGGTLSGNGTVTAAVSDAGIIAASGGTLVFNGAVTGSGSLVAGFGTAIDLTQGGTLTEAIFGAGTLKLDGTKTYILSASSLSIGTVAVDSGVALSGNGTITGTVADAGTLSTTYGSLLIGGAVSGAGTLSAAASTVLDLAGGGSFSGVVNGAGTLQLDGFNTFTLLASGSLGAASVLVDAPATLDSFAGGSLTGSIAGAGTLQLDGSTAYTISGATLAIGTLLIDAGVGLSGSGTITGAIVDSGTLSATGTLVLAGAVTGFGPLYSHRGALLTLEAGGALTEQISGEGTLQLSGTTAYTLGGGTISVDTFAIGAGAGLSGTGTLTGSVVDSGTLTASGGLLQMTGALSGTGALAAAASSVLDLTTSEALTENVSGAGTLQLDGGTYTLAGISDSVSALLVDSSATLSGAGTISGAVTDSGTVSATGGVLVLGAISGAGVLSAASSATLDLTGGGPITGASGAGTLQLDSGTYSLAGALGFGATHVDAGATLSGFGPVSGPVVDAGTIAASGGGTLVLLGALSGAGALSAGSAAEVELSTAETLTEAISGAGSLYLAGSGTYSLAGGTIGSAALLLAGGISLSGYGSVTSAVSNSSAANPSDTLTASGGKLILSGAISGTNTALQAVAGATLDLVAGGTLSQPISGAGTLELGGAYVLGSKAPTTASLLVDAGASLSGAGSLAGTITDKGTIDATTGAVAVGTLTASTGTLLASAGEVLTLSNGGTFAGALSGAGTIQVSGATTLSAGASLSAAHLLQKANITLGAGENASNLAGNTLTITAATGTTVVFTGTGDTLTNAGSLVANGAGAEHVSLAFVNTGSAASSGTGTLTFITTVTNSGTISASGGGVAVFDASVAGTGALSIGAASTLWLEAGSVAGQTASFGASTGTLDLSSPTHFLGTIDGFGGSDVIDLINTAETGFSFANGVLTVTNNTTTVATLHFGGSYTQSEFSLGSDGHSGTAITFV